MLTQARLCNIALFIGVLNHGYVGGIMGDLGGLDTRLMAAPHPPPSSERLAPMHGSIEFNLMYRFHSTIPERFLLDQARPSRALPIALGRTAPHAALHQADANADGELTKSELDSYLSHVDGRADDFNVDATLRASLCAASGGFSARNTPQFLRDAEAEAIELGRRFGVARLNDYRDMFQLSRFESMEDINPDPQVAAFVSALV